MSEQTGEPIELPPPPQGSDAFASLMDILVGDDDGAASSAPAGEATAEGGAEAGAAGAAAAGGAAPAGAAPAGDTSVGGTAGAPTAGEAGAAGDGGAGGPAAPGADGGAAGAAAGDAAGGGAGDRPAGWTASAADYGPKLGQLSTALEENTSKAYQAQALEAVKTDHANYFKALETHPRLLVGQQVPAIGKEGMETLRDTNDAREWQDAVKSILVDEVRDRAGRMLEENRDFLSTVHQSIELFQNNADLVPGTKDFDVELANRFATFAKPYELRVDGKLQGYSVPVQPLIDQLREQVVAERAKAAPAAASTPAAGGAAAPAKPAEPPQAGVQSKAGSSSEVEDFSTLFGTIGLPNLQI